MQDSRLNADRPGDHPEGFGNRIQELRRGRLGAPLRPFLPQYGGGGFPWVVGIAIQEMLTAANKAFSSSPLLTQGEAIDISNTTATSSSGRPTCRGW